MCKIILLFIIFFSLSTVSFSQVVKVFIIAGQSNADGRGKTIQLSPVPIWAQNTANGWTGAPQVSSDPPYMAYPRPSLTNAAMLWNRNNTGLVSGIYNEWLPYLLSQRYNGAITDMGEYGPELSFLMNYQRTHPEYRVAAIKCVLGGSSITDWLPDPSRPQNMYAILSTMIAQAKTRLGLSALQYEFAGLLWMQGESGAATVYPYLNPTQEPQYSTQLRYFLQLVRNQTRQDMPVVIGRIGNQMLSDAVVNSFVIPNSAVTTRDAVLGAIYYRRALQVEVGKDPNNTWVDTDNLPVLQDNANPAYWYHYVGPGYLAMGERFFRAYSMLIGETPKDPPPPPVVEVNFGNLLQPMKTAVITINGVILDMKPGDIIRINIIDK